MAVMLNWIGEDGIVGGELATKQVAQPEAAA